MILNTCRRFLQVGKASKEYYIQFCQEHVSREREVLLILKRDNLYSTEFMKFAIFKIRITDILSKIIGKDRSYTKRKGLHTKLLLIGIIKVSYILKVYLNWSSCCNRRCWDVEKIKSEQLFQNCFCMILRLMVAIL